MIYLKYSLGGSTLFTPPVADIDAIMQHFFYRHCKVWYRQH